MLDCFDGLISLDRTCAAGSGSVSLQSQGIDETLIGKFTGPEDTVQSLLADCEEQARMTIAHDVLTYYADRIIPRTFVDRKGIGEADERQVLDSGTGIGGMLVEVNQPGSNAVIRIGSLGLYANTTGPVTITIYDLEDGSVVTTHTIEAEAGRSITEQVQITLPAYRKRKAYFITHDLEDWYRVGLHGSCGNCHGGFDHGGVKVNGARLADGLQVKRSNLRLSTQTSGLSVVLTVECDHSRMLCEVKGALTLPYVLKVAECILRRGVDAVERMNSQRLDLDLLKERANRKGAEYAAAMENTVGKMRMPNDPMCFVCRSYSFVSTSQP